MDCKFDVVTFTIIRVSDGMFYELRENFWQGMENLKNLENFKFFWGSSGVF